MYPFFLAWNLRNIDQHQPHYLLRVYIQYRVQLSLFLARVLSLPSRNFTVLCLHNTLTHDDRSKQWSRQSPCIVSRPVFVWKYDLPPCLFLATQYHLNLCSSIHWTGQGLCLPLRSRLGRSSTSLKPHFFFYRSPCYMCFLVVSPCLFSSCFCFLLGIY